MIPAATTLPRKPQTTEAPFRIAMADDDRAEHLLMMMAADEAGIDAELSFHDGGQELIDHLQSLEDLELPEVIILDLRMPGLDGYGTLDELQNDPRLWEIPVVVFTSSTRPVERALSYDRGARLFQTKPYDFAKLVSLVRGLPLLTLSPNSAAPEATRMAADPTRPWIDTNPANRFGDDFGSLS